MNGCLLLGVFSLLTARRLGFGKRSLLEKGSFLRNTPSTDGEFHDQLSKFWKCSGSLKCLELQGLRDPSRTLEGNFRKRSESVSGVFPDISGFLPESPSRTGGYGLFSEKSSFREISQKENPPPNIHPK